MDTKTQKINSDLIEYIKHVQKYHSVDGAYLFGSHARGKANEYSDYDVAIVSDEAKNRHEFLVSLLKLSRDFDIPIEPHPMTKNDFSDPTFLLGQEVKRYGISLF
jgi:uncharacterized protein